MTPPQFPPSQFVANVRDSYDEIPQRAPFHLTEGVIARTIPFHLDTFRRRSLRALVRSKSIVLTAPTGAGKTVVAEMAIALALCKRRRLFYTTPLKALSNQKFFDLKKCIGAAHVGLLTGDQTINSSADVVVMTTEVFRNMLYKAEPSASNDVFAVVLDEFHFMNSFPRGSVIEEIVIKTPRDVLLVALSATMPNATDLKKWFAAVHGPTELIQSSIRPVPLKFYFCHHAGIFPLFAPQYGKNGRRDVVSAQPNSGAAMHKKLAESLAEKAAHKRPSFQFAARRLRQRNMLPAIFFIFSRIGCNRAAESVARNRERFVTEAEVKEITARVDAFCKDNSTAIVVCEHG